MLSPLRAPKRPLSQLGWGAGWFLAIAAATVGGLWWWDAPARKDGTNRLVEGLRDERLLPARLSDSFYARYSSKVERDAAFLRQLRQARQRAPGYRGQPVRWESLRDEARLSLADEPEERWEALLSLEAAITAYPRSAEVWSDLSAVRYSLALEQEEPGDFLAALDAAEEALELEPRQPEALFNRALCLEGLGLWKTAKETWELYLEEDDTSGWAEEAREHLQKLHVPEPGVWPKSELRAAASEGNLDQVREIVTVYRSPARRLLEEEILRDWGTAVLSGQSGAELLRAARTIATAYEELSRDTLYREAVEVLEQASGTRRTELATAHRNFGQAVQAIDQKEDLEFARARLESAASAWGDSPFAGRAELKLAIVDQRQERYSATLDRLHRIREQVADARSPLLLGETYWVEGTTHKYQDRLDLAAEAFDRSLPYFEITEEVEQRAGMANLQSELLAALGRADEVWRRLLGPLSQAAAIGSERRLYNIYSAAAISAWEAGFPRIGLLFWQELAPSWVASNPQYPVDSALWRARLLHELGRDAEARQGLAEAREKLADVPAGESQDSLEAEITAVEGEMAITADPVAAVSSLRRTLERYRATGNHVWEKRIGFLLGRALRGIDVREARQELRASLGLTERERRQLSREDRIALLENDRRVFAELTDLEFGSGAAREALTWIERQRSRTLLDRLAGEDAAVLTAEEIQRQLPAGLTLIEYAAVGGRWVAWAISSREVRGIDLQIREEELEPRVQRWLSDIQSEVPWTDLRPQAIALYQALILPLKLPVDGDWVIVPEGVLKDLPFAALHDGERFLIQRHALSVAPSANFFLRARQRDRSLPATAPFQALVLGNPKLAPRDLASLGELPNAAAEAEHVATLYEVQAFLGERAAKQLFLRRAPESEIVQVSGHARTRPRSPGDSALLLAGGALTAREIQRLHLDRTRLVVLSACSTASGPSRGGEGAESLAQAFLAAGVPGVVATLWDVKDQPTAELVTEFHRQLRQVRDARKTLQRVQIYFLEQQRPLAAWAAFQSIGEASVAESGEPLQSTGRTAK